MPLTSKKLEGHIASGMFVRAFVCVSVHYCIMPPTSKKLEVHIASGTFVRAFVCASICPLLHSITSELCMLGFWPLVIFGIFTLHTFLMHSISFERCMPGF